MSLIKNLVKESPKKDKTNADSDGEPDKKPSKYAKTAIDLQRLKLEKLMKNPDKPVNIPEPRKEKDFMQTVPSFVRNVMGSSAGAGSGEFHVYRHLRRKEYARQKIIQTQSLQEKLDEQFQQKIDANRRLAEEKTAKKRAKRLKRKQNAKKPRQQRTPPNDAAKQSENSESEASETNDNDNDKEEANDERLSGATDDDARPPEKVVAAKGDDDVNAAAEASPAAVQEVALAKGDDDNPNANETPAHSTESATLAAQTEAQAANDDKEATTCP